MRLFFLWFAGLFLMVPPCVADDRTINPDALQGVWSSPDCTVADSVWIISKYFFIHTGPGEITVRPVRNWRQEETNGDRYFSFDAGDEKAGLINLTNDGLMRIAGSRADKDRTLSAQWEQLGGPPEEYSHCAKLFDHRPALGQREVNSIFLLDHALESCSGVTEMRFAKAKQCHRTLFDLVDSDGDEILNRAELMQLYRQAEFLQAGGPACGAATVFYPSGSERSATFADDLLRRTGGKAGFAAIEALFRADSIATDALPFQALKTVLPFLPVAQTSCPAAATDLSQNNFGGGPVPVAPENSNSERLIP